MCKVFSKCVDLNWVESKSDKLLNGILKNSVHLLNGPGGRAPDRQRLTVYLQTDILFSLWTGHIGDQLSKFPSLLLFSQWIYADLSPAVLQDVFSCTVPVSLLPTQMHSLLPRNWVVTYTLQVWAYDLPHYHFNAFVTSIYLPIEKCTQLDKCINRAVRIILFRVW